MTEHHDRALIAHPVWDAGTRWFHWINVLCVLGLAALGLAILNARSLGVSADGRILLKTLHVWVGYGFTANLLWRWVWAFRGNRHARLGAMLPGGPGYGAALRRYLGAFFTGDADAADRYLGHNPAGRLAVTALFLVLTTMMLTGLVLAGTDLFMPPLGGWIAAWIAAPGVPPDTLVPGAKEMFDAAAYADMRDARAPIGSVHVYGFYTLCVLVVLHVAAVVLTEVRHGGALVSAMFTGRKLLDRAPVDGDRDATG